MKRRVERRGATTPAATGVQYRESDELKPAVAATPSAHRHGDYTFDARTND